MTTGATTIDSLFGPLPTVETRGQAWLYREQAAEAGTPPARRHRDGTNTEVLESDPEVKEGTEIVTNVIIEQPRATNPAPTTRTTR